VYRNEKSGPSKHFSGECFRCVQVEATKGKPLARGGASRELTKYNQKRSQRTRARSGGSMLWSCWIDG